MMNYKIPLFKIYWEDDDIDSVIKVIKRGNYWTVGPEIKTLEDNIAKYIGKKYAVTFNSGTSALYADLLAHNINSGEVIVPSFTFISSANSILLAGAKPIFAEIEDESFGLNSEDVKEKITRKTKAIMVVHYGGFPCKDIKAIKEIANDHNLVLIEDAAESFGSKIDNKKIGTFGSSSMFSFCQNKIITSGEGGIILTDLKDIFEKLKLIRSHGRVENSEGYFNTTKELDYIQIGYNFRMSSISAALANSQFKKFAKIAKLRRKKAKYYNKNLSKNYKIKTPKEQKNWYSIYQMYTIQLENKKTRDALQRNLKENNVLTKVYFNPIHLTKYYREKFNYKNLDLPTTENISNRVLTLPIYPNISKKELDYIIKLIINFIR